MLIIEHVGRFLISKIVLVFFVIEGIGIRNEALLSFNWRYLIHIKRKIIREALFKMPVINDLFMKNS